MTKKFTGKTCVYCATENSSQSGDHIFARQFFPIEQRDQLPQVPSCVKCNNEKSILEHYLTSVLPMGGRQPGALENLRTMVPPRLDKNKKLQKALSSNRRILLIERNGRVLPHMELPFEHDKLLALFRFIIRGLLTHHWNIILPQHHFVGVVSPSKDGIEFFSKGFCNGLSKQSA